MNYNYNYITSSSSNADRYLFNNSFLQLGSFINPSEPIPNPYPYICEPASEPSPEPSPEPTEKTIALYFGQNNSFDVNNEWPSEFNTGIISFGNFISNAPGYAGIWSGPTTPANPSAIPPLPPGPIIPEDTFTVYMAWGGSGTPGSLIGWYWFDNDELKFKSSGIEPVTTNNIFQKNLATLKSKGVQVFISLGGDAYTVSLPNEEKITSELQKWLDIGIDGFDIDFEGNNISSQISSITAALTNLRSSNDIFKISAVPEMSGSFQYAANRIGYKYDGNNESGDYTELLVSGLIDYLWPQFYNNEACQTANPWAPFLYGNFPANPSTISKWQQIGSNNSPPLYQPKGLNPDPSNYNTYIEPTGEVANNFVITQNIIGMSQQPENFLILSNNGIVGCALPAEPKSYGGLGGPYNGRELYNDLILQLRNQTDETSRYNNPCIAIWQASDYISGSGSGYLGPFIESYYNN